MSEQKPNTSSEHRDEKGQFLPGNPGGPGNPYARETALLRKKVLEKLSPERLGRVVDAMIEKAEKGDVQAAKLLFQYSLGKPLEGQHPDEVDKNEMQIEIDTSEQAAQMPACLRSPDVQTSVKMVRTLRPVLGQAMREDARRQVMGQTEQDEDNSGQEETESAKPSPSTNRVFRDEDAKDDQIKDTQSHNTVM